MTNVETARALLAALNVRQVGHSTAQRKGWENVDCTLVVANQRQANAAHSEGASVAVTLEAVTRGALAGRSIPVVVEHDVLRLVLQGLLDKIDGLEGAYQREHARLTEVLGALSEFLPPGAEIRPALAALRGRAVSAEAGLADVARKGLALVERILSAAKSAGDDVRELRLLVDEAHSAVAAYLPAPPPGCQLIEGEPGHESCAGCGRPVAVPAGATR